MKTIALKSAAFGVAAGVLLASGLVGLGGTAANAQQEFISHRPRDGLTAASIRGVTAV